MRESSNQALYRKYRSRSLDEVVGQAHVTDVLARGLKQGKIAHAYLLTGPRGVGKTSIARILAHEINQLPYDSEATNLDIIEIDAASNNGVDDVRDLRDKVRIAPVSAAKKVYIIDEVHMLSKPAFNALLKTLEEPPEHVVFILATTDLHKVPATIISRTQHFAFRSISPDNLVAQLRKIAKAEGMKVTDDALAAIAERGDGSFRDSISLLDQLSSFADEAEGITGELVASILGLAGQEAVQQILEAVAERNVATIVTTLRELEQAGVQPTTLADQLIRALQKTIAEQPSNVALLDALLDVASSPQPQLKLLTTLVGAVKPKQTTVATIAAAPKVAIEKPLKKLEKIAEQPHPTLKPDTISEQKPASDETSARKTSKNHTTYDLDWQALIEETRKNHLALHSVLSKCEYELAGDTLTLYTGKKFSKTKLDDAKYLTKLHEALAVQGIGELQIITIATPKPPADEKLAAIAAMMGGGQEVSLDES